MQDSQVHGSRHGQNSNCGWGHDQLLSPLHPGGGVSPGGGASLRLLRDYLAPAARGQRGAARGRLHHQLPVPGGGGMGGPLRLRKVSPLQGY